MVLLPRLLADPLLHEAGLRNVPGGWSLPEVPVSAVFAGARYLSPNVRVFIELAHATFVSGFAVQPAA